MHRNKNWSTQEDNYLKEYWTNKTLNSLAKNLNRSTGSVFARAKKLKLGGMHVNRVSINMICNIMQLEAHTVRRWINDHGLKATKITTNKHKRWHINIDDLLDWLEKNQDRFDSRRLEYMALGSEPIWLREKKKKDIKEGNNFALKYWTDSEVENLRMMFRQGKSYKEIARKLGRTTSSISQKLVRIKSSIWL